MVIFVIFSFTTYSKLYSSIVIPVTDYAAGVWGFKNYDKMIKLKPRTLRTFLGVGKQTSLVALDRYTMNYDISILVKS